MSKLLENKQILHIASEVIVLTGLVVYISQLNKKVTAHVEELTQRLDDQEDAIKKHEKIFEHLLQLQRPTAQLQPTNREELSKKQTKQTKKKIQQQRQTRENVRQTTHNSSLSPMATVIHMSSPFSVPKVIPQTQKIRIIEEENTERKIENTESDEEDEEELDSEIRNELKDLLQINSESESEDSNS